MAEIPHQHEPQEPDVPHRAVRVRLEYGDSDLSAERRLTGIALTGEKAALYARFSRIPLGRPQPLSTA
jgi:hypothetical protein